MRNLKKILCLALVLSMVLAVVSGAAYTNYADDAELTVVNEDYLLAAQLLQDIGVVVGVKDGSDTYYKPDQLLTRAELARVLYVLYSAVTDDEIYNTGAIFADLPTTFTDIDGHWAEGYIKYGQSMGYLNGKSAEIFDPDATVKAQEMATALLLVIGYKAADIAPNYPANVVKYGYATKGNLFTTGLSDAYAAEETGVHVVGVGAFYAAAGVGIYVLDTEKELALTRELTREEAFYMMYKAITKRSMVSKFNAHHNADGEFYYETQVNFLKANFGLDFEQKTITDVVSGSANYNFKGGYAAAGTVVLHNNGKVTDFGYTATQKYFSAPVGVGYTLSATDWDKNIGKEITGTLTTWGGKTYLTGYAFNYAATQTAVTGPKGSSVTVLKAKEVAIDNDGNIKIDGVSYAPYYAEGYRWIVNYSDGVALSAAQLAEVLESKVASNDEIVLKVIGKKLYGVIEEENFFAEVIADPDKDGYIAIELVDGWDLVGIKADFKKGDRVFGFYNNKSKAWELSKVEATVIDNVAVKNGKYYIGTENGTEFFLGATSDLYTWSADEKVFIDGNYIVGVNGQAFVPNEPAYWALYITDGYCFDAVKTDKVQKMDLFVTAKSKVVNTADNKVTYTFALNTKKDGTGTAYTFVATGENASYEKIVAGDTVIYFYDAKTLAAISIKEFKTIEAKTEKVLANEALSNIDTVCATAASVIEALGLAAAETDVEFRIVLPAKNGGATKAPIVGEASQKTEIESTIGANVVIADYQFVTLPSLS